MEGNRVGRGGRESQQGGTPLPLIGSPFGPLGISPPGPMQPLTPGMSPGSGRPGVSSSVAGPGFNNSEPVGRGAQPDKNPSGFVDVDWAGDVNDRRSTRGFCFTASSAAISWCSKKQSTVALSSCEAEYVAATMATQEYLWFRRLSQEMCYRRILNCKSRKYLLMSKLQTYLLRHLTK